eukprot:CAMPEP_0181190456 /NCGR_PEP_ID=MMETSP1096-20121128/12202_1 /TAXON_ID=156174 ORGANISM="Chrysochromulina ericina, Strain CCMP281" /NCGR_SAMPLE_ID=MMETSP1096 /ASSEMBLY_ACC=CAM_ASM_000453 /LENGTH=207 /DNA_ID=CAMNT_0023279671 /DNA_START=48 /DNA_END=672 /DNA_ORIENTATION=+
MRYVYDVFSGVQQTTIGSSFVERNVTVESSEYKLRLWDTAGQERFDALTGFYARGARAVIICYDMTDRETFDKITTRWLKKVEDDVESGQCHLCIVGTKKDLVQAEPSRARVTPQDIEDLKVMTAEKAGPHVVDFFETSAKDNTDVAAIFLKIAARFHAQENPTAASEGAMTLGQGGATPKAKGGAASGRSAGARRGGGSGLSRVRI